MSHTQNLPTESEWQEAVQRNLIRSLVALLDDYGFPDDQPANYRNENSIGNRNLRDWHKEAKSSMKRPPEQRIVSRQ